MFTASNAGLFPDRNFVTYSATKAATIAMAKLMAVDHAGDNVRVNALSPGAVATRRMLHRYGSMEKARRTAGPKHLLNRLGEPDEIAHAVGFIFENDLFTGRCVEVDAGLRI